jgi:hypothetical protein
MAESADDGADEVKVFRKNDAEDLGTDSLQSSVQLHEDKQDVAFEAEMETQTPINGQKPTLPFSFPGLPPMSPHLQWIVSFYLISFYLYFLHFLPPTLYIFLLLFLVTLFITSIFCCCSNVTTISYV